MGGKLCDPVLHAAAIVMQPTLPAGSFEPRIRADKVTLDATIPDAATLATTVVVNVAPSLTAVDTVKVRLKP